MNFILINYVYWANLLDLANENEYDVFLNKLDDNIKL